MYKINPYLWTINFTLFITENCGTLKILLSFAVGALLGDVFLHLLPEAYESEFQTRSNLIYILYPFVCATI